MGRPAINGEAARRLTAGLLALGLSGCMETRFYPLCVYAGSSAFVSNPELYADVAQYAREVAGERSTARTSTNRRVVAVRTLPPRHRALAARWPQVACIGPTDRAEHINNYRECIAMMQRSLGERRLPPLQRDSDGSGADVLYCVQGDSFSRARGATGTGGNLGRGL